MTNQNTRERADEIFYEQAIDSLMETGLTQDEAERQLDDFINE